METSTTTKNKMKYKIKNLTPKVMECIGVMACPAIYEVEETKSNKNNKEKTK